MYPMQFSGSPEQVVAAYRVWVADPQRGTGFFRGLAEVLVEQGKTEEAITVYREAMTRKGGEKHLYRLSELLVEAKQPDEAIKLYQQAIAKNPKEIEPRESLAKLYGEAGKSAERLAALNEVVSLYLEQINKRPNEADLKYDLAQVYYLQLGRKDEARKLYGDWINSSRDSNSLNAFAMVFAAHNKPENCEADLAIKAATRACELTDYANYDCLDTLATAYAAKGDFETAVKWQLKAIEAFDDKNQLAEFESRLELFREKKTVPPSKLGNDGP